MKKDRNILKRATLFSLFFAFGIVITLAALSSSYSFLQNQSKVLAATVQEQITALVPALKQKSQNTDDFQRESNHCFPDQKRGGLQHAQDASLQRLAQLEEMCDSGAGTSMMIFIPMPNSVVSAQNMGNKIAGTLKEFSKYNVQPIIIVEPITQWGQVDFEEFGTGFYNGWIGEFFAQLKREGVSDAQIGTWVPFPEANLPYWNRANSPPEQFGKNVVIYAGVLHKYYPNAKLSIMLNATSYPSDDFNWQNGTYTSLIPYITSIPPGTIDSFGIQGFPWISPASADKKLEIFDPAEFIGPDLAIEAANYLKVKKIWVNTGTFKAKYATNPSLRVTIDAQTRQKILSDILTQLEYIKSKDFSVTLNLFSEDKSNTPEATNWAYWGESTNETDQNTTVLMNFLHKLSTDNIEFWYFDRKDTDITPSN